MPKFADAATAFSHNGRFLAVAERRECKDYVNVLSTENWELLKVLSRCRAARSFGMRVLIGAELIGSPRPLRGVQRFAVDSSDLVDLTWSPDDSVICVQDTALEVSE